MITVDDLTRWLEGVSFAPGWTINAIDTREGPAVVFTKTEANSRTADTDIHLRIIAHVPPHLHTRERFDDWLLWRVERIYLHEAREWLQRDSKPIFDPHETP